MAKTGLQMELTSTSRQEMTLEQFGLASGKVRAVSTMWFVRKCNAIWQLPPRSMN